MTTTTSLVNLSRTILGSLTSTFTPPATCAYLGILYVGDERVGWRGQGCENDGVQQDELACWPPTTAGAVYPSTPFSGWGFYSPGLVCPTGYTSACTATASGSADWPVQFELEADETAVGCCPTGYTCTNQVTESGQTCYLMASSTSVTTATCDGTTFQAGVVTLPSVEAASTSASSTSTFASLDARAPMIQINWKASDRTGSAATSTATSSTTAATATSTSGATSNDSPSTGAIVGIAIGLIALLAALAAAGLFVWRRKRRPQREQSDGAEPWREGKYANAEELPDSGDAMLRQHSELPTQEGNVHEMPDRKGAAYAAELPDRRADGFAAELPG